MNFLFLNFLFLFVNITGLLYLPYWYLDSPLTLLLLLVNITSLLNLNEMFWQTCCVMTLKHIKLKLIYWETPFMHSQISLAVNKSDQWFVTFDMFWIHSCVSAKPVTGLNMRVLLRDSGDSQLGLNVCETHECVCFVREKQEPDPWRRGRQRKQCEINALWRWNWISVLYQLHPQHFIHFIHNEKNYTEDKYDLIALNMERWNTERRKSLIFQNIKRSQ